MDNRIIQRCIVAGALLFALTPVIPAAGQGGRLPSLRQLQVGLGAVPGIGIQAGYVAPRSFYTIEGMLYTDAVPGFSGGEGSVQVSAGIGAALRPLGILRTFGETNYPYDLDVGLRFGPGLFFAFNETRVSKNQRFSLFLEPFVRFSTRLASGRMVFAEAGIQRPLLRAGLWFDF